MIDYLYQIFFRKPIKFLSALFDTHEQYCTVLYTMGLLLVVLLVALGGHRHVSAIVDRNNAFIGYSENSDESSENSGVGVVGEGDGSTPGAGAGAGGCLSEDQNENCIGWALAGECEKNAGYMRVSCAHSCKIKCVTPLRKSAVGGTVVMHTSEGDVRINLREDISPTVANYFKSFAVDGTCGNANAGCTFYRSEGIPKPGAVDNYGGPGPPVGRGDDETDDGYV